MNGIIAFTSFTHQHPHRTTTGQSSPASLTAHFLLRSPCSQSPSHTLLLLLIFIWSSSSAQGPLCACLSFSKENNCSFPSNTKEKCSGSQAPNYFPDFNCDVWVTPSHPYLQFGKECWSPAVPEGFCCHSHSSPVKSEARWEAERDQESLTEGKQKKHLNIWLRYAHSNCTQLIAHTGSWGQKSRGALPLGVLPTTAIKNWVQEHRSETLQASQKPLLKAAEQKEKQTQDADQMRSAWGSSETKLRQVDVSHTRLHSRKNSFSSLPPSKYLKSIRKLQPIFNYLKRTTGFYHCKLQRTKTYISKTRILKYGHYSTYSYPKGLAGSIFQPCHMTWSIAHFVAET